MFDSLVCLRKLVCDTLAVMLCYGVAGKEQATWKKQRATFAAIASQKHKSAAKFSC